jgi:integrase
VSRSASATPQKDPATGTWWFIADLPVGPDGRRRQAKRRGFRTRAAAQAALDELRTNGRQGTYVAPARQPFGEFLDKEWLPAVKRELAETSWESYARNVKYHVQPYIGRVPLQSLDGEILNRLYATLLESGRVHGSQSPGLKPRTVRYVHTIIHAALDDAVRWRRVPLNAADQATPPSAKSARAPEMSVWSGEQLTAFLQRNQLHRDHDAWMFLATTGCRRGEALGLRWKDIDFRRSIASVRQQVVPLAKASGRGREGRIVDRTKGGEGRAIELDSRTVSMLRAHRKAQAQEKLLFERDYEDHDLVFARIDGRPQHPEVFSKTFDRRVRLHGFGDLPVIRLHDLRHTWATLALQNGVDVKVVSERLGHSSPVITWTIYQHVVKGMQADAAERVADAIFGANGA